MQGKMCGDTFDCPLLTQGINLLFSQIADFGMSRDLMDENYYVSHGGKVPIKWTAPEVRNSFVVT